MRFVRSGLAVAVAASLSACSGGGGSSTMGAMVRPTVPFHVPVRVDSFHPHHRPHQYHTPLTEIYARDLNGDRSDEVLWSNVAFNESGQNWINSQIQIFGFNTGQFANETSRWFAPGDNIYTGGFRINFGDFNGSGRTDVFVTTFTDTPNHTGPSVMLTNTGRDRFQRFNIDFGQPLDGHDTVVADFNRDGIDDVLITGSKLVLGSRNNDFRFFITDQCHCVGSAVGAGLSAADYLGDGSVTVVMTDGPGTGSVDTMLFRPVIESGRLVMQKLADLPPDRFFLSKWDAVRASTSLSPHAVRNIAMDFNQDGRPDVVVFSTMPRDGNVHGYTEVQFLRNDGAGRFTDVTDSVLRDFSHDKTVSYNPVLMDVNHDGLQDIFMSTTDYTGQLSTSVLLATREGYFVESYSAVFSSFANQIMTMTSGGIQNQPISIIAGPGNTRYLISGVAYEENGVARVAVYASLIGSAGTVSAQATIDTMRQIWPWMSSAELNAALARSTVTWVNGIPVADLQQVLQPVGTLGITMSGRDGKRWPIHGSLRAPGFDARKMMGITAVDDLGRDFRVDLDRSSQDHHAWPTRFIQPAMPGISWGMKNFHEPEYTNGVWAVQTEHSWGWAMNTSALNSGSPWQQYVSVLRTSDNPWVQMSGMFGKINHAVTIESGLVYQHKSGTWAQIAAMQTSTDLQPGLVSRISPIWSLHGSVGWRRDGISVSAGLLPTIVQGQLDLRLPDRVDQQGVLHYRQESVRLRNAATMFAGLQHDWQYQDIEFNTRFSMTDQARYDMGITAKIRF